MNPLKRLLRDKRGIEAGIVGIIITVLVTLFVGIIVVTSLINAVKPDTTWSASANSTWSTLQSNTWVAFTLLVIIPIILGAVAILGYLKFGGGGT